MYICFRIRIRNLPRESAAGVPYIRGVAIFFLRYIRAHYAVFFALNCVDASNSTIQYKWICIQGETAHIYADRRRINPTQTRYNTNVIDPSLLQSKEIKLQPEKTYK